MNDRKVPVAFKEPYAVIYNAPEWESLRNSVANPEFTALEIKGFYTLGLILEIFESVDCLLKSNSFSENGHPLAYQVFASGGRYLPAFGIFASGVELLGRCLTGNETIDVNQNLNVGFHYLVKPDRIPLLNQIPMEIEVVKTGQSYSIQDLIDLRNYAAHGQSTVGEKDVSGKKRIPKSNLPGIEKELFYKLPHLMEQAIEVFWKALIDDVDPCIRLARARMDPYNNRIGPLKHVISYFGQRPHQSAGSLFSRFNWKK
jgi:hypothetical protein